MHHVGCMAGLHHALNLVRFRINPELDVVQDRVHGSRVPYMVRGAISNPCKVQG